MSTECQKDRAVGDARDELEGAPSFLSPAAVVLHAAVAPGAVLPPGRMRKGPRAPCGRVGLFVRAALDVTAHVVAHLEGRWRRKRDIIVWTGASTTQVREQ